MAKNESNTYSGTLSALDKRDYNRLLETLPRSNHPLVRGIELPIKLSSNKPLRITLPGVIGVSAAAATMASFGWITYWWAWIPVIIAGYVTALIADELFDEFLPVDPALMSARSLLKSAKDWDKKARRSEIQCTIDPGQPVQFCLPEVGAKWTPRGDSDDKAEATEVAGKMSRLFDAIEAPEQAAELESGTATTKAVADDSGPGHVWARQLKGYDGPVADRAGEAADDILSTVRELTRHVNGVQEPDETTARTLQQMRDDTIHVLGVYTQLDESVCHTTLDSGLSPTDELAATLDTIGDEAKRLHNQGQASQADELSYMRRLNESRYKPSSLDDPTS